MSSRDPLPQGGTARASVSPLGPGNGDVLLPAKRSKSGIEEERPWPAKKRNLIEPENATIPEPNTLVLKVPKPPCQPLGNLLAQHNAYNARGHGLGRLGALPDEILISIFSELSAVDLIRIQAVSHAFYAFSRIEGQWKHLYITASAGQLGHWRGTWRSTYLCELCNFQQRFDAGLPTDTLSISDIYSDALYLPYMAARFDPSIITASSKFSNNINRVEGSALSIDDLGDEPAILTGLMENWPALRGPAPWSLRSLARRFPEISFRAEAVLTKLSQYIPYHDNCIYDESPLYIFDSDFVEKSETVAPGDCLQQDFEVPNLFQDDLFSVLGDQRPNYRWLIAGPARSGSTFHCDPNATSAWNAVVTGRKLWVLFPPHIIPPGVFVSQDEAEVETPLSLAEWLFNYYHAAKRQFGPHATCSEHQNVMLEGICNAGEIFYVPSGWWHLVVNLEDSIAVTQNFVSRTNLSKVLLFLRNRPDQVSGFRRSAYQDAEDQEDESSGGQAGALFEAALKNTYPHIYFTAQVSGRITDPCPESTELDSSNNRHERPSSTLWDRLHSATADETPQAGFTFDFDL